jgi:hypothetical protein
MMELRLSLEEDGAEHLAGAASAALPALLAFADKTGIAAGTRLHGHPQLAQWLDRRGTIGRLAAARMGSEARPVRAILFDKSPQSNWSLGWHQDRTIAVRARREVAGFGPWTVKRGMPHVAPPVALLRQMLTVRVHLDDVPRDNAPLLLAPGSHRLGRIPEREIDTAVQNCGTRACIAHAGDVWLYATLILHASEASQRPGRRRVLQVDYVAAPLPGGLEWLGV